VVVVVVPWVLVFALVVVFVVSVAVVVAVVDEFVVVVVFVFVVVLVVVRQALQALQHAMLAQTGGNLHDVAIAAGSTADTRLPLPGQTPHVALQVSCASPPRTRRRELKPTTHNVGFPFAKKFAHVMPLRLRLGSSVQPCDVVVVFTSRSPDSLYFRFQPNLLEAVSHIAGQAGSVILVALDPFEDVLLVKFKLQGAQAPQYAAAQLHTCSQLET